MYKLTQNAGILRISDNAFIPADPENTDYQEVLAWCEEGNVPLPADPAPVSPATCSPWQIRKALNALGLRQAVDNAVATSSDQDLKDGWDKATEFRSDDPFVLTMGAALGKDADETRELIGYASTL